MEKIKLVVWGDFRDYDVIRPTLLIEEMKGNVEITAVMFLDEGIVKTVDGYPAIKAEDLLKIQFDYIVGLGNDEIYRDMVKILNILGISREQLLPARILELPDFDFQMYMRVRDEHVSIISDNCWGGLTYHSLNIPFLTPFINLFVRKEDFVRLTQNLPDYMKLPLEYVKMETDENKGNSYPKCMLGDIEIHFNHYSSFDQARQSWDIRKARINYNNILVKMQIETERELNEFDKIPYRKIGFSSIPAEHSDVIDFSEMVGSGYIQREYKGRFWEFINWQAGINKVDLKHYNVMKLLLGEKDFRRTKL